MRLCTQVVALKGNCGMTEISDMLQRTNINDMQMKTQMNEENVICDKEMIDTQEQDANLNSHACSNESMADAESQKSLPGATRLTNIHNTVTNNKCLSSHEKNADSDAQANNCDKTAEDDLMMKGENKRNQDKQGVKVEFPLTCHVVNQKGEVPCPRWRHTALVVGENGRYKHSTLMILTLLHTILAFLSAIGLR